MGSECVGNPTVSRERRQCAGKRTLMEGSQAGNYPQESVEKLSLFNNLSNLQLYIEVWISLVVDPMALPRRAINRGTPRNP